MTAGQFTLEECSHSRDKHEKHLTLDPAGLHLSAFCSHSFCAACLLEAACDMTHLRRVPMAWTTPKITEIPLGAEINSYVCGQKK